MSVKNIQNYILDPKKCKKCDIQLTYEKRHNSFCSQSCCAKYNNKIKNYYCIECNKTIDSTKKFKQKYCSTKCQREHQYKTFIKLWKNGEISGMAGKYGISNHIRRYLFEKYNNCCKECGWSKINPSTGKIPLQINHKDGNHKNNTEDNLELICPSCHSLTPNFGNLNRGNGRKERYKTPA